METTTQNMLTLLHISLSGKKPDIPVFSYKEWEDIYWLARKHGVVTMINDAIEMLPPDHQPQGDIALSWTLSAERTRYHFNHQAEVLQRIDSKAQAEGLPYVLLKGMSLARLYPRPDSRACGDIDICFPHNYEQGNALLGNPNPLYQPAPCRSLYMEVFGSRSRRPHSAPNGEYGLPAHAHSMSSHRQVQAPDAQYH